MNRNKIMIAGIIVLLLAAGAAIYYSIYTSRMAMEEQVPAQGTESTTSGQVDSSIQESDTGGMETASAGTEPQPSEPLNTEEIDIRNNSAEYDLKMILIEDSEGKTALKLEYYYDGSGTVKTFESGAIPEIDGIFEKRADNVNVKEGSAYKIEKAYLNTKLAKVYFVVNGNGLMDIIQSDMYVISLADASIKKVFSNRGKYGDIYFSKDFKYLAYSYNDPPESSVLQESSLLEVIDCSKDDFLIKNSRLKEKKIGANLKQGTVYDYTFKAWHSANTVRLMQNNALDGEKAGTEVLYDFSRDLILNRDGTVMSSEEKTDTAEPEKTTAASETGKAAAGVTALSTLKDFYSYLASESEYPKAMELLDDTFKIKLAIFSQFGIDELTKDDISAEDAAFYSDMLRAASFDTIVSEELLDDTVTIYYYQNLELSPDNPVRQPMSALVKKKEKGFKIILLQDADDNRPPFKMAD